MQVRLQAEVPLWSAYRAGALGSVQAGAAFGSVTNPTLLTPALRASASISATRW
jgi:hypothetical protein